MSFFSLPELSNEEVSTYLDSLAKKISEWEMDFIAIILFSMLKPFSLIVTHLGLIPLAPFLHAIGIPALTIVSIFQEPSNVEYLIDKIEFHRDAITEVKARERAGKPTFFDKLKKKLGNGN